MATGTVFMETAQAVLTQPVPSPAAPSDPNRRAARRCLAGSALSGVLLWMCFQPLALGAYLGWIALVPLFVLIRAQGRPKWIYFCALLGGMCFYLPSLRWMPVAHDLMYGGWALLALYCSLYFVAAIFLLRRLDRWRLPLVVTVPLVWTALEYARSFVMTGFAWYLLAHTQHDLLPMIQITDLGGVFLVSALVALVNVFLFECLVQFLPIRSWFNQAEAPPRNLLLQGTAVALLVVSSGGYGVYRLGQDQFERGPTVCLLQPNLDQRLRNEVYSAPNNGNSAAIVTKQMSALCIQAAFNQGSKPDLLIWPETSYPRVWIDVSAKLPIEQVPIQWRDEDIDIRAALKDLAGRYTQIPHLLGMNTWQLDAAGIKHHYNSALLVNAEGRVAGRFDKMHRVPFGEYVPLDWLPFMKWFTPYDFDYGIGQGEKFTRFPLCEKYNFGVLICYEDSDPSLARQYVRPSADGPAVDFLVNISNDGWFDGTSEHEEHLAVSRFRAIECRRAMVRAVNMGVSAVIDGNGRVLKPTPYLGTNPPVWVVKEEGVVELPVSEWHHFKKVAGILRAAVPIDRRFSFYAFAGDWLPIGCWLFLFAACGLATARRRAGAKPQAAVT